jgi:hypothetical protein
MTILKRCLDSRSSDEAMMLCALDSVAWFLVELDYTIRTNRGNLLELVVHGSKGDPRPAYDPATKRRIPKPAKDVPTVKKPKIVAVNKETGEKQERPAPAKKGPLSRAELLEKRFQRIQKQNGTPTQEILAICDWGGTMADNLGDEFRDVACDPQAAEDMAIEARCLPEDADGKVANPATILQLDLDDDDDKRPDDWYVGKIVNAFVGDPPSEEISSAGGRYQVGGASASSGNDNPNPAAVSAPSASNTPHPNDGSSTAVAPPEGKCRPKKRNKAAEKETTGPRQSSVLDMSSVFQSTDAPPLAGLAA